MRSTNLYPLCLLPEMLRDMWIRIFFCILVLLLAVAHRPFDALWPPWATHIPPHPQREGDPERGYRYLIYGDYVSSGVPLGAFKRYSAALRATSDLGRTGDSKGIPFAYNVVTAAEGARMVAPTCLTCHAAFLFDTLVVGLGSTTTDYTRRRKGFQLVKSALQMHYGKDSPELAAFARTERAYKALSGHIQTLSPGVNPADKIFAVLAAYRDPVDLHWLESPRFDIPKAAIPTDVPPWWHMRKKHMLYYNGLGRGDFARLSMSAGLLTMIDSTEARRIDNQFADVMAWIRTLEPPVYPFPIDSALAAKGQVIFDRTCSGCHGTYGATSTYPNLIIDLEKVGTDPYLAQVYERYPEYHNWFNNSWFAADSILVWARLLPTRGYVAPPLDGLWATAPYLHNGSVPTVWDVLDSRKRPVYWARKENDASGYDHERLGWGYTTHSRSKTGRIYNTKDPGYGNQGHTFGDHLDDDARRAVVEYLKTL